MQQRCEAAGLRRSASTGKGRAVWAHVAAFGMVTMLIGGGESWAEPPSSGKHADTTLGSVLEQPVRLQIAPQALADAVTALSLHTTLQVLYEGKLAEGRKSPGVSGTYTPREALERLLAGTGLTYRVVNPGTVTLEPASPSTAPVVQEKPVSEEKEFALPPVMVEGERERLERRYNVPTATTATKTDTPIMETPLNIQVVPQQVLKDQQIYQWDQGPLRGLKIGGGVVGRSQAQGDNENTFQLPGYVVTNLMAAYPIKVGRSTVSLQLNVDNLLDKSYFYFSTGSTAAGAHYGAPRTFLGSVRVDLW